MVHKQLRREVEERLEKGYSLEEIKQALKNKKWSEIQINRAIEEVATEIENQKSPWYQSLTMNQKILIATWIIVLSITSILIFSANPEPTPKNLDAEDYEQCGTLTGFSNNISKMTPLYCVISKVKFDCKNTNLTHIYKGMKTNFKVREEFGECVMKMTIKKDSTEETKVKCKAKGVKLVSTYYLSNISWWRNATYLEKDWQQHPNCTVKEEKSFFEKLFS